MSEPPLPVVVGCQRSPDGDPWILTVTNGKDVDTWRYRFVRADLVPPHFAHEGLDNLRAKARQDAIRECIDALGSVEREFGEDTPSKARTVRFAIEALRKLQLRDALPASGDARARVKNPGTIGVKVVELVAEDGDAAWETGPTRRVDVDGH